MENEQDYEQDTIIKKIFFSNFSIYVCLYLFPIVLIQNWISDYPNRLKDIFGFGFSLMVVFMYFWGMFLSGSHEKKSFNDHFWIHLSFWVCGFGVYFIYKIVGGIFGD